MVLPLIVCLSPAKLIRNDCRAWLEPLTGEPYTTAWDEGVGLAGPARVAHRVEKIIRHRPLYLKRKQIDRPHGALR